MIPLSIHNPLALLALSLALFAAGGFASLLCGRNDARAIRIAGLSGALGGLSGLVAGLFALAGPATSFSATGPFPFAHFVLRLDPLAGLLVAVISALALVGSIYGLAYVREYAGRGVAAMGFFMNVFIASMLLVVTSDNAFWFLIFFEMISLASYFLVIFDQEREAVSAGFLYFVVAHAGSVLIMAAFFLMANATGSFDFAAFRSAHIPEPVASIAFVLGLLGFGAKAGVIPLHVWLPRAHPAAPSHASALMSGVMIKIGVFGIVKVAVDLLGASGGPLWWGLLVLAVGAVSSVLGVIYALAEHDIKKLLAYHSVENIGIILLGVGVGMVGLSMNQPVLAALGFMAGFYHLVNHAVFKGLLFLCAGSVIFRLHTKSMDHMGGLSRQMPWTAVSFLIGALAISAIPPLNGFVSEWFTYQSLFRAARDGEWAVRVAAPVAAVALALTGALAVMCFVKAYGVIFSGPARHHHHDVKEVPSPMRVGMALLALACVALGLASPWVAPVIGHVASATAGLPDVVLAQGAVTVPGDAGQALLSTPVIAVMLLAMGVLPVLIKAILSGHGRPASRRGAAPWAAGYLPDSHMPITAGSFAQPIRMFFRPLYSVRDQLAARWNGVEHGFDDLTAAARRAEPRWDVEVIDPVVAGTQKLGEKLQVIQGGDFRIYCLYIIAALVVLLALVIR
ncbi:hydrogenase-4 component B [Rhodoblastus acidophilus]|uniref:hydrogenase 4 subunit B n=1 Tax=Rhodoblastus acidophilus TaxID=1074 RepID=UPI002224FE2F|nr:hydrogenase 4 subunit B [Rhodoblastus acidophilus]MCW2285412.1 hydrogenase-4 component B [Rhodoblastus acidophilus]MCW2334339.1 hydrogenase-4 component B [Rhodoblastus acidophilus]